MPLGIGKYSEHIKISTECFDDDQPPERYVPCSVRFIGQQNIPMFNTKEVSAIVNGIYNKNYSPLNSLIYVKKYQLMVDAGGINVFHCATKKCHTPDLYITYPLQDLIFITGDYQHERLFGVVYHGPMRNCVLHLYLCTSEDDVKDILNRCCEVFPSTIIKRIEKSPFTEGFEIIQYKPYENIKSDKDESCGSISELLRQKDENSSANVCDEYKDVPVKIGDEIKIENSENNSICDGRSKEFTGNLSNASNFGEFQSVAVTNSAIPIPESPVEEKHFHAKQKGNLMDDNDDELEDEFSQLALKRNIYLPEHLQDKSVESTLLYPQVDYMENVEKNKARPSFFSSYSKLQ